MENDKPIPAQMFTVSSTHQNSRGRDFNNGRGNGSGHFQTEVSKKGFHRNNFNRGNYSGYRGNFHGRANYNGRRPYLQCLLQKSHVTWRTVDSRDGNRLNFISAN